MFCWLSKLIAARRLDDGKPLPASVHAHLDQCAACRDHYDKQHRLVERLSATAAAVRREAPPFLHARILAHLEHPSAAAEARRRLAPAWAVAGVMVLGAAAVFLTFHFNRPPAVGGLDVNSAFSALPGALSPMTDLPSREAVLSLTAKFDEPLADELRLVMDDARTALSSLSRNLLPEDLLASLR